MGRSRGRGRATKRAQERWGRRPVPPRQRRPSDAGDDLAGAPPHQAHVGRDDPSGWTDSWSDDWAEEWAQELSQDWAGDWSEGWSDPVAPWREDAQAPPRPTPDPEAQVAITVQLVQGRRLSGADATRELQGMLWSCRPLEERDVAAPLGRTLVELVARTRDHGWSEGDLEEAVRRVDRRWLRVLRSALAGAPTLVGQSEMAAAVGLIAMMTGLPGLLDGLPDSPAVAQHPKWQQVRALLAKAESTEFGAEAEALVAKAQELISRHALEDLLDADSSDRAPGPRVRRLWLDRPYVVAKALLVDRVARANRCRSASSQLWGFSVLVGEPSDLDAVELLVTSLLAQADAAMLRSDPSETQSGARAYRRSFLLAYAVRVGDRLEAATQRVVGEHPSALPVLRDVERRVAEAFDAMVPVREGGTVSASDGAGWAAGTAAADLAQLDVRDRLP